MPILINLQPDMSKIWWEQIAGFCQIFQVAAKAAADGNEHLGFHRVFCGEWWWQVVSNSSKCQVTRPSEKQPKHDSLLVLNEPFRFFCKWLGVWIGCDVLWWPYAHGDHVVPYEVNSHVMWHSMFGKWYVESESNFWRAMLNCWFGWLPANPRNSPRPCRRSSSLVDWLLDYIQVLLCTTKYYSWN